MQIIITWLQLHPYWALFFTLVISFAESLAIIGSLVPGSVTMTAIGILAGSGVMRIDLTFIAGIIGAILGDAASYALGAFFSERLVYIWPFRRYPRWLKYGQEYFTRHGGKSVLIGRFFGPLRSLIPIVAGMMHMQRWPFFCANVFSAIGWSILYILPGVLIGSASLHLPTRYMHEVITFILIALIMSWIVSLLIKHFYRKIKHKRVRKA